MGSTTTHTDSLACWIDTDTAPSTARSVLQTLASLPERFRDGMAGSSHVVVIDGTALNWVNRLRGAIQTAGAGVLVRRPCPVSAEDVRAAQAEADNAGIRVVLDRRWSSDPLASAVAASQGSSDGPITLIHSAATLSGDELPQALLDQIGLVTRVTGHLPEANGLLRGDGRGYSVALSTIKAPTLLTATITKAVNESARVTAYTATSERHITIDESTVLNSRAHLVTEAGQLNLPPAFQNGQRASLIRLHGTVSGSDPVPADLGDLADQLELLHRIAPSLSTL